MTFRADEAELNGLEEVRNYLIGREFDAKERERSEQKLLDIVGKYGPVVNSYPSWHPLVANHDDHKPATTPDTGCGYKGLDHTRLFRNAFLTCPYGDGQKVLDSVKGLPSQLSAKITAERLHVKFYSPDATPILVRCDWEKPLALGGMIPASLAVPLMLQKEVPCCEWSTVAETWESMRPYFLGSPHGSRSSLFVNQETAMTMKKIWELLIHTGMYGAIKVSN